MTSVLSPSDFVQWLKANVRILDGAMGSMIQRYSLSESDFRGQRFADHPHDLRGNNDMLALTRPDVIESIQTSLGPTRLLRPPLRKRITILNRVSMR